MGTEPATETTALSDRYELVEKIGEGGQAVAWKAEDRQTTSTVVVKQLAFDDVPEWKAVELFEREAETLESLDHPQIPAYRDHGFERDETQGRSRFWLVQDFVDGEQLGEVLEGGRIFEEGDVRRMLEELLEVVAYLHGHTPPVVHRDIKPTNIILREEEPLALVDFGAVQVVTPETAGGSTVIGTSGYVPVEQLMGRASPRSDVYAIGATAIHLSTRKHPAELDVERNRLQFRPDCHVSDELADLLERMVAPAAEDRFADAEAALDALRGGTASCAESVSSRDASDDGGAPEQLAASETGSRRPVRDTPSGITVASRGPSTVLYEYDAVRARVVDGVDSVTVECRSIESGLTLFFGPMFFIGLAALVIEQGGLPPGPTILGTLVVMMLVVFTQSGTKSTLTLEPEGYHYELGSVPPFSTRTSGPLDDLVGFEVEGASVHGTVRERTMLDVATVDDAVGARWMANLLDDSLARLRRGDSPSS